MNLIDEYIDLVSPHLDAPNVFIEASAYHLISSLLGRFCASASAPGLQGLRPNAWIIISSIPARGRRSTVANYCNLVYEHASRRHYENIMNIGHDEALRVARDCYIEGGTQEGIIDHISSTDLRTYYINSTEFGAVLQSMIKKDHELGVSALYSKLYYGESGVYRLSKKSAETEEDSVRYLRGGKYVSMFAGLQEPHLYITPGMLKQGLIRRILLIYADKNDFGTFLPPLNDSRSGLRAGLKSYANRLYDVMSRYHDYSKNKADPNPLLNKTFDFDYNTDVIKYINDYAKKLDDELLETMSNISSYRQTLWEHLAKYSMLHAIARDNVISVDLGNEVDVHGRIDMEDVLSAKKFVDEATKHSDTIISELGRVEQPLRTSHDPLERVLSLIRKEKVISRSKLYRKTKMLSRSLDEVLKTLIEQEMIDIDSRETDGRPKIFYVLK